MMGYKTQLMIFHDVEVIGQLEKLNKFLDEKNVLSMYTESHNGSVMAFVIYTNEELKSVHHGAVSVIEPREYQEKASE